MYSQAGHHITISSSSSFINLFKAFLRCSIPLAGADEYFPHPMPHIPLSSPINHRLNALIPGHYSMCRHGHPRVSVPDVMDVRFFCSVQLSHSPNLLGLPTPFASCQHLRFLQGPSAPSHYSVSGCWSPSTGTPLCLWRRCGFSYILLPVPKALGALLICSFTYGAFLTLSSIG